MSTHDPFDGIYDESAPSVHAEPDKADADKPEQEVVSADGRTGDATAEGEHFAFFGHSYLQRMDKDDLQARARERGLDSSGTRPQLIERIVAWQEANAEANPKR
jgi:hypothetical protein